MWGQKTSEQNRYRNGNLLWNTYTNFILLLFWPFPPHVSQQYLLPYSKDCFPLLKWRNRYFHSCPFSFSPTLFFQTKTELKWGRTSALVSKKHKAGRSQPSAHGCHSLTWNPGLYCKLYILYYIYCNEVRLQLRYCTGNTETCLFSSFLVESPLSETRSKPSILIHCF